MISVSATTPTFSFACMLNELPRIGERIFMKDVGHKIHDFTVKDVIHCWPDGKSTDGIKLVLEETER